jgi:hypothetical protein
VATLEQLETALVNANKAGDMDAVRRLAPVVKGERDSRASFDKGAPIPGMYDDAEVAGTTAGAPKTSVGQDLVGAGETALTTATGATTGTVGMLGGFLKGMADNILSGKYGTQEGADIVAKAAEHGARLLTYEPKTQAGQQQVAAVGNVIDQATPLIPLAGELAPVSEAAAAVRPVIRAAGREAVAPIQQAAADLAQQVKAKMAPDAVPTAGTGQSAGAAAVDMATQRQAAAESLPVPIKLTEGQKTREFDQQRFERETAKNPEVGEPIRQRFQDQNLKLQQNMDAFIDDTGAELTDARGVGEVVDKALRSRAGRDKTKIRALYKEADKAGEMQEPVDAAPVLQVIKDSESAKKLAPIIGATEDELNRLVSMSYTGRGNDKFKLTLGNAEQLRKFINKGVGADPTNIKYGIDLKKAIDTATEGKGGELYKQARAARSQYANDYENFGLAKQLLNTKRGSTDRSIAMEDVLHKSVVSPTASLDTVTKLRQLLESEGDTGKQAWKELQGGTLRHIRDEALKGVTTDSAGNRVVSAAALDRVVTQLDKTGKLDYILGKKKAEQVRTINDVAKDVLTSPPGVVNTSNTATVLAGLLDVGISGMTGVPAPVASTVRLVTSRIKDAKLRARVKQSLGE